MPSDGTRYVARQQQISTPSKDDGKASANEIVVLLRGTSLDAPKPKLFTSDVEQASRCLAGCAYKTRIKWIRQPDTLGKNLNRGPACIAEPDSSPKIVRIPAND